MAIYRMRSNPRCLFSRIKFRIFISLFTKRAREGGGVRDV